MMDIPTLARRMKEIAYLEGDFTLRSGKKSHYYLDKYLFETQPDILAALGAHLAGRRSEATARIGGAELGGLPFFIVRNARKGHGTNRVIEGAMAAGDAVLLVEDIATTGGAVLAAAKIITAAGGRVEKIVAVIDRQEGARENIEKEGFVFESILTRRDLGI